MARLRDLQSTDLFQAIEHALYVALGAVLSVTALAALIDVVHTLWLAATGWDGPSSLLAIVDRLLFVLMLAEILHTVRVSIKSGALTCEPFLVVGLIACIRRVLVITLETSQPKGTSAPDGAAVFQSSMIELGVLGALILVMVISIYLVRRASDGGKTVSTEMDCGVAACRRGSDRHGGRSCRRELDPACIVVQAGIRTLSMTWMTPFVQSTSAVVTVASLT